MFITENAHGLTPTAPQQLHSQTGEFRTYKNFQSRFLSTERDVIVYLPPGYFTNKSNRYPAFYLHDGQNLFDGATSFIPGMDWRVDETAEALIRLGELEPLIIVGIYNTGHARVEEYTPTSVARLRRGGKAHLYGRMIVEELKPLVDSEYRTLPDPANTGLGGASLGGLVTIHLGIKYPEVFGKLAVMSPSVWWDNRVILRDIDALNAKLNLRIWLDMGTAEGEGALHGARLLRDALVTKKWIVGADLHYYEAECGKHNEESWGNRMDQVLKYLFPAKQTDDK